MYIGSKLGTKFLPCSVAMRPDVAAGRTADWMQFENSCPFQPPPSGTIMPHPATQDSVVDFCRLHLLGTPQSSCIAGVGCFLFLATLVFAAWYIGMYIGT